MANSELTYELPDAVAEVTPMVRALGTLLPIDGRLSWIAGNVQGFAPLHCYLVETQGGPILLDTGAPVHEAQLLAQLDRHLPPDEELALVLSRIVEFDSFGNAGSILERYPVVRVYSQFPVLEWVYYRHVHDGIERTATPGWTPLAGGLELSAAGSDEVALEAIDAPVRLLATWWFYEPTTRVLFTSDSFGHVHQPEATDPACVGFEDDTTTYEQVRDHLIAKFDWLALADTGPIRKQLEAIFGECEIEAIAPSYGRPIIGSAAVQRHYDLVQRALAELHSARR